MSFLVGKGYPSIVILSSDLSLSAVRSVKKIYTYNLPCIRILPVDGRSFFIIAKPFDASETQQFGFLWKVEDPTIIEVMLCLDAKIKWQHQSSLL